MCSVKVLAKFVLFALACVVCTHSALSQAGSVQSGATGITIKGTVLLDPQQSPVKKASIKLSGPQAREECSAVSDADGRFVIEGVAPGSYFVQAEHPGLVANGRNHFNISSQSASEVLVHMQSAAVITGKITDADGDSMSEISVIAQRVGAIHGWRANDFGHASTNDLGEFRISGLRPGRYTVSAAPPRDLPVLASATPAKAENHLVYVTTYYPGTLDKSQAVAVDTQAGQETPANFGLLSSRAFRVTGDIPGLPSADLVEMTLTSEHGLDANQRLQPDGKFEFANLLPGTYNVEITVANVLNRQGPSMRILSVKGGIEVNSEDIHDLHLQLDEGSQVTGRFRMDNGAAFDWTQLTVTLVPSSGEYVHFAYNNGSQSPTFSAVAKDGTFEMKTVPAGKYQLIVGARGSSDKLRDYFTKSVMLNGQDVIDSGIEVNSSINLDLVISARGATIEGKVVDEKGNPVQWATVVDVPDSEHSSRTDLYQRATTDQLGHFSLRGLNPGSYTVLAFEDLEDNPSNSGFLATYGSRGEKADLEEGSDKNVVLKIVPASTD